MLTWRSMHLPVTSYINKYIEDVTASKIVKNLANQKPWMRAKVHALLRACDAAFKSGDKVTPRTVRGNLSWGIQQTKRMFGSRIHCHLIDNSYTRYIWLGIKTITDSKMPLHPYNSNDSPSHVLNHFYVRFGAKTNMPVRKSIPPPDD